MATTNSGTAAARRRRIAEKGAERLALITGRTQSLSPPSDQVPISDANTDSPLNNDALIKNGTADDYAVRDGQPIITIPEIKTEASAEKSFEPRDILSFLDSLAEQSPASFEPRDIQSLLDTLPEQNPSSSSSNKLQKPKLQTRLHETFSPKRLRPAIKASENTRTYCSIIMALLVLLSCAGFPILSNNPIKNIILFRPLFLLIVTNITIVVAPILLEKVNRNERRGSSTGEAGFANNIGTVLEWGMLMKTGLSALFMDCSIYSVVVICGLCYMQRFGW